jgi:hypothetical protein
VFCCLISVALCAAISAKAQHKPFVFAHYMHNYVLGGISQTDPRVLDPARVVDLASWPTLGEESEWFSPQLSAIAALGAPAIAHDFDNAEAAGIDAFGLLLGPKMLPRSAYSDALQLIATAAQARSVKLVPEIWGNAWTDDYRLFGTRVKEFMGRNPGAFQSWNGKPMLVFAFQYSAEHNSVAQQAFARDKVFEFLEAWGGPSQVFWIAYLPYEFEVATGSPLVAAANAVDVWTPQDDWSALHSVVSAQVTSATGKDLAWPVAPAFYQRRAGLNPWEYGNSFGAARYIDAWQAALRHQPEFVDVQTWNDFSEDSAITDTNTSGNTFLHLTSYLLRWLRTGHEPTVSQENVMLFRPKQLTRAALTDPDALVKNAQWRHKTPTVDYLDCVTLLRQPAQLRIKVGDQEWHETVPAGLHETIIYVPQSAPPATAGEVQPANGSFPVTSAQRTVRTSSPFPPSTPTAEVIRAGRVVLDVQSRIPFLASGQFQDFTLVGDEAVTEWQP